MTVLTHKAFLLFLAALASAPLAGTARSQPKNGDFTVPSTHSPDLPKILADDRVAPNTARWTIPDIVEVRRIRGTAIQGSSRVSAFILEQPSIADSKNHYGLYQFDADRKYPPKKLAEADYMADLAWRPNTKDWTVRADFGSGVQLYAIKQSGIRKPLLIIADTEIVGGNEGMLADSSEGPRLTGVVSYGWAKDGRRFWYSRLRRRDKTSQSFLRDNGLVFDEKRMHGLTAQSVQANITLAASELREFDTRSGSDKLVDSAPVVNASVMFRGAGSVAWVDDTHLQYRRFSTDTGNMAWTLWRVDIDNGDASAVQTASPEDVIYSSPTENGYLTLRHQGPNNELVEVDLDGRLIKQYGPINARYLARGAVWQSPAGDKFIYGTQLADRNGLDAYPEGFLSRALSTIPDYLTACSFNSNLSFGVCSAESLTKAPTLVSISGMTGQVAVIARPNARYDAIAPLKTVAKVWTNRYGAKNTGYITYPRNYVPGRLYPALVVTHGWDAKNYFARDGFEWEFPIQVMAELGYFILSVNEPYLDQSASVSSLPSQQLNINKPKIEDTQQFNEFMNPTDSLEASVEPLIASGQVNPKAVGIAGYSHGAETTYFVISHSKLFSAASLGDDPGVTPSWFWSGIAISETLIKDLYGGSPFDPAFIENYRKYSTSFRLREVQTPLLQQFAGTMGAATGLEVHQLFTDASIPTELVDYPGESHIFYAPRHRASAMERNLDWFNYWMRGARDLDPAKADQYSRWDVMAARWRQSLQK